MTAPAATAAPGVDPGATPGSPPSVSVVVVSRHRNLELLRCLAGLAQLDHPRFEIVVVADSAAARGLAPRAGTMKILAFDEENISAARNMGLGAAAGEVVAFLDDDAVPEPSWLSRLVAPFADPRVGYAAGYVRGFNGISFQWRARTIDRLGREEPAQVSEEEVSLHSGTACRAMTPIGTNCAFRRDAALALGGFDPAYRYFREESDLALRFAAKGWRMAVVPRAQVHHARAQSSRRSASRAPTSLEDVGASSVVFLRRHATPEETDMALDLLRLEQRARLRRMVFEGRLRGRHLYRLMTSLERGILAGRARDLTPLSPLGAAPAPFLPHPGTGPRPGLVLAGRPWSRRRLHRAARAAVEEGVIVTVLCFGPSGRPHRMRFDTGGFWEQSGGLFGRAARDAPRLRFARFSGRVLTETARFSQFRPVGTGAPGWGFSTHGALATEKS